MSVTIHQQLHGYQSGHQLLQSSLRLDRKDQDLIDHLSDITGPLRPDEEFNSYLTTYPLPSLKYYVLARTEQDLDSPRAGCVKTKSLLVPQLYWENEASPASLTELFKFQTSNEPIIFKTPFQAPTLPTVKNPAMAELVEALFLEKRQAIVAFEIFYSLEIALRLLTAFWPGIRRRFSLCTFALSPRTLSGKPFDLLFAPISARARFSNFDCRRVEEASKTVGERHRWTSLIEKRIFFSSHPYLLDKNSIRTLVSNDDEEYENVLRLSLLWDELREKAISSPTAILGLIDIASSRDAVASAWEILEPTIVETTINASENMETESAWKFLITLNGKLGIEFISARVIEAFRMAGTNLTKRDWRVALNYLVNNALTENNNNREMLKVVASSIATVDTIQLTRSFIRVSPERLVRVALLDDALLACFFHAPDKSINSELIQILTRGIKTLTNKERNLHIFRFLRHIRGDQDSKFLAQVIVSAQASQLVEAVELVWGVNELRTSRLGKVFCDTAMESDSRLEVCTVFAQISDDEQTNQCIERLLVANPDDMRWLLKNSEIENRRTKFLANFIERSNSDELSLAFNSPRIAIDALKLFAKDFGKYATVAARIVVLPSIKAVDNIAFGIQIYRMLNDAERKKLAQSVAVCALTDVGVQNEELQIRVIETVSEDLDYSAVITIGLDENLDGKQVSRTLVVFDKVVPSVRVQFEANLDIIVRLVTNRRNFDLTADGTMALARLIEGTLFSSIPSYVESCSTLYRFAIVAHQKPVTPIIVATFPVVYDSLIKDNNNFGLMTFFMFIDWDKCRVARKNLVRAFLQSNWPPVDLAITALRARELNRILKRLVKESGGREYLKNVEKGAKCLKKEFRKPILKAIREVQKFGSFIPESET